MEKEGVSADITLPIILVTSGTRTLANRNSATEEELPKGLAQGIDSSFAPLSSHDINCNNPVGPNSGIAHNYSGAFGIINATYAYLVEIKALWGMQDVALHNVSLILGALLLNKDILTNNNTQNLNTQSLAQKLFDQLYKLNIETLVRGTFNITPGFQFKVGPNKGKNVLITIELGVVNFKVAPKNIN